MNTLQTSPLAEEGLEEFSWSEARDLATQALQHLAEEDKRFRQHWLWERLRCTPEEFFENFQAQLNPNLLQTQEWKDALDRAQWELKAQLSAKQPSRPRPVFLNYGVIPV